MSVETELTADMVDQHQQIDRMLCQLKALES
jgi:hypothetical protein